MDSSSYIPKLPFLVIDSFIFDISPYVSLANASSNIFSYGLIGTFVSSNSIA